MTTLRRVLEQAHAAAWRRGFDVLPVPRESRGLRGMEDEDVFRLQGVLQRAVGQAPGRDAAAPPPWAGLVAEALQLAERGVFPRSQFLQDVWVLRATRHQRDGFFVEVGAGDGRYLSNSYLLETSFGWRGALCEPNPSSARKVRTLRPATLLLEHAVSDASGDTVHLTNSAERSAVVTGAGRETTVPVTTITPTEVLLAADAPDVVDYLSIDTEGSEPTILRSWPWDAYHVRFLTVEHNHVRGRLRELDGILLPKGYRRVMQAWSGVDAWYAHRDEAGAGAT